MTVGETKRQTVVCDVCQTYVATSKPGAPQHMIERAFNVAINMHLVFFHKNDPEAATFSYGFRK